MTQDSRISADLSELMDAVKGRDSVSGAAVTEKPADELFPFAAILQKKEAARKEARREEILGILNGNGDYTKLIGENIEGQGIFLGRYTPQDRDGNSLSRAFNVFASPRILTGHEYKFGSFHYDELLECFSKLKDWCGFDGAPYKNDTELYEAIKNRSYDGGWIIPPIELLDGCNVDGAEIQPDNFSAHKDKGKLWGMGYASRPEEMSSWQWSCTESKPDPGRVKIFGIVANKRGSRLKEQGMSRCIPVRLAPVQQRGVQP